MPIMTTFWQKIRKFDNIWPKLELLLPICRMQKYSNKTHSEVFTGFPQHLLAFFDCFIDFRLGSDRKHEKIDIAKIDDRSDDRRNGQAHTTRFCTILTA